MIYFIQDSGSRAIKIGISKNPVTRLSDLQTAHASKLLLIGIMDGARNEEQALHRKFQRLQGEWFEQTPDLMEYIHENAISLSSISRPVGLTAITVHIPLIQKIYIVRDVVLLLLSWLVIAFGVLTGAYITGRYLLSNPPYPHPLMTVAAIFIIVSYTKIASVLTKRIAVREAARHAELVSD